MELTSVSVIELPLPLPVAGVIPATAALVHVYAGAGVVLELVILYVLGTLLHQFAVAGLVITAVGLTVTATSFVVPGHPFTVGTIR